MTGAMPLSELPLYGVLGSPYPRCCIAPVQHPWAHRTRIGCLEGYYLAFFRFLRKLAECALPHRCFLVCVRACRRSGGPIYRTCSGRPAHYHRGSALPSSRISLSIPAEPLLSSNSRRYSRTSQKGCSRNFPYALFSEVRQELRHSAIYTPPSREYDAFVTWE